MHALSLTGILAQTSKERKQFSSHYKHSVLFDARTKNRLGPGPGQGPETSCVLISPCSGGGSGSTSPRSAASLMISWEEDMFQV